MPWCGTTRDSGLNEMDTKLFTCQIRDGREPSSCYWATRTLSQSNWSEDMGQINLLFIIWISRARVWLLLPFLNVRSEPCLGSTTVSGIREPMNLPLYHHVELPIAQKTSGIAGLSKKDEREFLIQFQPIPLSQHNNSIVVMIYLLTRWMNCKFSK